MKQTMRRLIALERSKRGPTRLACLFDDGTGKAQAEADEIEREHGDDVQVIIFSWIRSDKPGKPGKPVVFQ